MIQASAGCTISIRDTSGLADGSVFDRSTGRDPLTFRMGAGQIIPGLKAALDGMGVGETKIVTIPPPTSPMAHITSRRYRPCRAT